MPQQRRRVYIGAVDTQTADASTMSRFKELVGLMESRPSPLPLSRFLLPDNHHIVMEELRRRCTKRNQSKNKTPRWVERQLQLATDSCASILVPCSWAEDAASASASEEDDTATVAASAWLSTLNRRERNNLKSLGGMVKKELRPHAVLDLSQGVERRSMNSAAGWVNCLTPSGLAWHLARQRPLMGIEKLAIQNVFPECSA